VDFVLDQRHFQITIAHATEAAAGHLSEPLARRLTFSLSKPLMQVIEPIFLNIQNQQFALARFRRSCATPASARRRAAWPGWQIRSATDSGEERGRWSAGRSSSQDRIIAVHKRISPSRLTREIEPFSLDHLS
jgi:hypothetical protein